MDDEDDDADSLLAMIAGGGGDRRHVPLHLVGTARFELKRKLGTGAFGDVYEARDREHGAVVALKTLKSSHPDWIYRFKREFRIVGDLAHPNLVRMFELFVEDDRWYLTMELIEGMRFDAYLRATPGSLRSCFEQLARGLGELHRAGCLHRDVKPSNALVTAAGRVVLLDFGLAVNQHAAIASAIAGTPPYMAPELGLRQPATEASDWYAFGVMLYEALAGELPFTGDEAEMLRAKLREPPPPPSDLRVGVDPRLEELALDLLERDPASRPLAADVVAALTGAATPTAVAFARGYGEAPPIVGRLDELAALEAAFAASRDRATVVEVIGPPGIGKTALVGAFIDRLRDRQQPVYQGRCLELESVPLKGLDAAIDELSNDLSRRGRDELPQLEPTEVAALVQIFPMIQRVDALARMRSRDPETRGPAALRQAAARALRELTRQLGPVVLFLDDIQWTGDDSVDLVLEFLAEPAPPVLIVVGHRCLGGQPAPGVERLVRVLTATGRPPVRIEVRPLTPASVDAWIDARAVPMTTAAAMRETDGHPYLLARLLHASVVAAGPVNLAEILDGALAELDGPARQLVDMVAIAGGPTSAAALFEAVALSYDPSAIDQLRRRKLVQHAVTAAGPVLDTYHARVRATVLAGMAAERVAELSRQLADVVAARRSPTG